MRRQLRAGQQIASGVRVLLRRAAIEHTLDHAAVEEARRSREPFLQGFRRRP